MITKTQDKLSALSPKLQAIVPIAAFTAKGEMQNLRAALESGLEADLSVREIKGVLVQLYSYAGFPRCLNAIAEFMDVLKDRQQRGLASESDLAAGPLPSDKSRLDLDAAIESRLAEGETTAGLLFTFVPDIDLFLKDHLADDIFKRGGLCAKGRGIAVISALAALDGVLPQLQAHFDIGINVALSEAEAKALVSALRAKVGKKEADQARVVLSIVLGVRKSRLIGGGFERVGV